MGLIVRRADAVAAVALLTAVLGAPPALPAAPPGALPPPGASIPVRPVAVLPALDPAAAAPSGTGTGAALAAALNSPALGPSVAADVVDVATGVSVLDRSAARPAVPASTAKILTAAALLSVRGPQETLATRVVAGAGPREIVLVGGGDVLLAPGAGDPTAVIGRAGLDDLAVATAAALTGAGTTAVSLRLDDTLFAGPTMSPDWGRGDVAGGFVAPITALAMDSGNATPGRRPVAGHPFRRAADPALAAAAVFAQRLGAHGITVSGAVRRAAATPGAVVLAQVSSATLGELVEEALTDSDNTVAEALGRLVALSSNRAPTFAGAGAAILDQVALLGVPTLGQTMAGGSGLGSGYAVSPRTLVQVLALAAKDENPHLRAVLTGLPVAGASGTLADRFGVFTNRAALGVVRAKTGTLTGASSLAGTLVDADGRMLAFAVLADQVKVTDAARSALDVAAAALARCGCH